MAEPTKAELAERVDELEVENQRLRNLLSGGENPTVREALNGAIAAVDRTMAREGIYPGGFRALLSEMRNYHSDLSEHPLMDR